MQMILMRIKQWLPILSVSEKPVNGAMTILDNPLKDNTEKFVPLSEIIVL